MHNPRERQNIRFIVAQIDQRVPVDRVDVVDVVRCTFRSASPSSLSSWAAMYSLSKFEFRRIWRWDGQGVH